MKHIEFSLAVYLTSKSFYGLNSEAVYFANCYYGFRGSIRWRQRELYTYRLD